NGAGLTQFVVHIKHALAAASVMLALFQCAKRCDLRFHISEIYIEFFRYDHWQSRIDALSRFLLGNKNGDLSFLVNFQVRIGLKKFAVKWRSCKPNTGNDKPDSQSA